MALSEERCETCRKGAPPMPRAEAEALLRELDGWTLAKADGEDCLQKSFKLKGFAEPLAFAVRLACLAERQDHHPRLVLDWGKATVAWWTHSVGGLHRNDFVMAARTDKLLASPI